MSVLSRSRVLDLIKSGALKVEPFSEDQVGPGSVDLHLGSEFRTFRRSRRPFSVGDHPDYARITKASRVRRGGSILVAPGELIHAITEEKVTLPENVAALIEGRSSLARVGLLTHLSSGFVHPGTSNRTVLEVANVSPVPLTIRPGIRICQLILLEVTGEGRYQGRFAKQLKP